MAQEPDIREEPAPDASRGVPPWLSWVPILALMVATGILWKGGVKAPQESLPFLLALSAFLTVTSCLFVARKCASEFLGTGRKEMLYLGCGALVWGAGSAAVLALAANKPDDARIILSFCAWLSALCHLGGAVDGGPSKGGRAGRLRWMTFLAAGSLAAVAVLVWAVVTDSAPTFLLEGAEGAVARWVVLGSTMAALVFAASTRAAAFRRGGVPFENYYGQALLLFAMGVAVVAADPVSGDRLGWTGSWIQLLGSAYLALAVISLPRRAPRGEAEGRAWTRREWAWMLLALVIVGAGAAVRFTLLKGLGGEFPYLTFYPAVMLAALVGGLRSGLLATLAAGLLVDWVWLVPAGKGLSDRQSSVALVVFLLSGLMVSFLAESTRKARARAMEAEALAMLADEKARAADALREREARFRTLAEATFEGIVILEGGRIVDANDQYCRLLGCGKEEVLGMALEETLAPEDRDKVLGALQDGAGLPVEHRLVRRDGSLMHVESVGRPFLMEGRPCRVAAVQDVGPRRTAREILDRYRLIAQYARDGLLLVDLEGRVLEANQAAMDLYGYRMEEMRALRIQDLRVDSAFQVRLQMEEARRRGILFETVHQRKDGTRVPVEVSARAVALDGQEVILSVIREITLRKLAEAELEERAAAMRESNRRLAALSEAAAALLHGKDPASLLDSLARKIMEAVDCQVFFNILVDPGTGRRSLFASAGVEPEDASRLLDFHAAEEADCGEGAAPPLLLEARYGVRAYACHPLRSSEGVDLGLLAFGSSTRETFEPEDRNFLRTVANHFAVALDNLEGKRALRRLNEQLEQRVAQRTVEVRALVDQLRGLTLELSVAEQRERKRLAVLLHDHLQQHLVAAQMQLMVIKRSAGPPPESAVGTVDGLLREAIDAARSLAVELSPPILHQGGLGPALGWLSNRMALQHAFQVEVDVRTPGEPGDEAVKMFLFEAARELLFNAIKHSGVDRARVALDRDEDGAFKLEVADEGVGFDPLQPASDHNGGFGLFSIQQRLAHLGGRTEILGSRGRGSRIVLHGPPERDAEPRPEPEAETFLPGTARTQGTDTDPRISVLLVDDHQIVREGLERMLLMEPDLAVAGMARGGREAVELVRILDPDVVVTDVSMAGMSGIELTRILNRERPGIRVIGLSMHPEAEVEAAMREAGAVDYLTKGGPSDLLAQAIRKAARNGEGGIRG